MISEKQQKNLPSSILKGMGVQNVNGPQVPHDYRPASRRAGAPGFAQALQQAEGGTVVPDTLGRPVPGGIVKPFAAGHPGVDLQAAPGSPVRSAAAGVVESNGWIGGYGNLLIIRHQNQERAYYAHLQQAQVQPGQQIQTGQQIALSGDSGDATEPHLHFEIRQAGRPLDPTRRLQP